MKNIARIFLLFILSFLITKITMEAKVAMAATTTTTNESCSYDNDSETAKAKAACEKKSSGKWSCKLNRCLTQEESISMFKDFQKCAELTDVEARKACHDKIAKDEAGNLKVDKPNTVLNQGITALTTALAVINFAGKSGTSSCISKNIFTGVATGSLLSEAYFTFFLDKQFDSDKKKYSIDSKTTEYDAQVKAFQYLLKGQKSLESVASQKSKIYKGLALGYGAAAAAALYDWYKEKCESSEAPNTDYLKNPDYKGEQPILKDPLDKFKSNLTDPQLLNPSTSIKRTLPKNVNHNIGVRDMINILMFITTEVFANGLNSDLYRILIGGTAATGAGLLIDKVEPVKKWFATPAGIGIISLAASAITLKLALDYDNTAKQAGKNANVIKMIIKKFNESAERFCAKGNDDLSNPRCYCYTSDGKQNPKRSNSETCKKLWAASSGGIFVDEDDPDFSGKNVNVSGCLTRDGKFDETCSCKKFIDKNGNNACYKVNSGSLGTTGNMLGLNGFESAMKDIEKMASGNFNAGNLISYGANAKNAAKIEAMKKQFVDKYNNGRKNSLVINDALASKIVDKIATPELLNSAKDGLVGKGSSLLGSADFSKSATDDVKKMINLLPKENLDKLKAFSSSGKGHLLGANNKDEFAFNLDDSNGNGAGKVIEQEDYMKNKYNLKDSEINKDDGKSIWDIITNRYNRSALPKLFKDE